MTPPGTVIQRNVQVALDDVVECANDCQAKFETVLEKHTKDFYKKNKGKKVKLSSVSVEVTDVSSVQSIRSQVLGTFPVVEEFSTLEVTYAQGFEFKNEEDAAENDSIDLALDS